MIINVTVIPRSRQNKITVISDGNLKVHTTAAPTDGQANEAVIKQLSDHFGMPKSQIQIVRGSTGRKKVFSF